MSIAPFNRKPVRLLLPTGFPKAKTDFAVESLHALVAPAHVTLGANVVRGGYADELVKLGRRKGRPGQLNCGAILDRIIKDVVAEQETHRRYDVLLLEDDVYADDTNFVFGSGVHNVGCAFSFHRFGDLEAARTVLMHELGHAFSLPTRTERVEENLGTHCVNKGCLMRQSLTMGAVLKKTRERLAAKEPICRLCKEDLMRHFWVMRPDDESRTRRNSDEELRALERKARTGGPIDRAIFARAQDRASGAVVSDEPFWLGRVVGKRGKAWEATTLTDSMDESRGPMAGMRQFPSGMDSVAWRILKKMPHEAERPGHELLLWRSREPQRGYHVVRRGRPHDYAWKLVEATMRSYSGYLDPQARERRYGDDPRHVEPDAAWLVEYRPKTPRLMNGDAALRVLERRARETNAPSDVAALISARTRTGLTDPWLVRAAATLGHEAAKLMAEPLEKLEVRRSLRDSDMSGRRWILESVGYSQWISGRRGDGTCALCGNVYDAHSTDDTTAPPPAWVTRHGESCPGGGDDGPFWVPLSDEQLDAVARAEVLREARAGDRVAITTLAVMLDEGAPEAALVLLGGDVESGRGDPEETVCVAGELAHLLSDEEFSLENYRDDGVPASLPWFWRQARPIISGFAKKEMLSVLDEALGLPTLDRISGEDWQKARLRLRLMLARPRVAWFLGVRKKIRDFVGLQDVDVVTTPDPQLELPSYGHGGYPILYSVQDDEMCGRCANQMEEPWTLTGANTFLEGPPVWCEGCAEMIESAYGDPNAADAEAVEPNPPPVRRNGMDERLRGSEREARLSGDAASEARVLVERMRAGEVDPEHVMIAAVLGDAVARIVVPGWLGVGERDWLDRRAGERPRSGPAVGVGSLRYFYTTEPGWSGDRLDLQHMMFAVLLSPRQILDRIAQRSLARLAAKRSLWADGPEWATEWRESEWRNQRSLARQYLARDDVRAAFRSLLSMAHADITRGMDLRDQAWGSEMNAQADDLIALLLGRPLPANPSRRNSDASLRALFREWRSTGDKNVLERLLLELGRHGLLWATVISGSHQKVSVRLHVEGANPRGKNRDVLTEIGGLDLANMTPRGALRRLLEELRARYGARSRYLELRDEWAQAVPERPTHGTEWASQARAEAARRRGEGEVGWNPASSP